MGPTTSENSFWKQNRPTARTSIGSHRSVKILDSWQRGGRLQQITTRHPDRAACRNLFHNRRSTTVDISTLKLLSVENYKNPSCPNSAILLRAPYKAARR